MSQKLSIAKLSSTQFSLFSMVSLVVAPWLVLSSQVCAHETDFIGTPSQLVIKSAIDVQNQSIVADDQAWLIPGVMLGGEATPQYSGVAISDVQLLGFLNLDQGYYLGSKLAYHQHQGEGELSLENFWLGKSFRFDNSLLKVDIGQMATDVTPTANYHSSEGEFNSRPLLAEVFFGGHHKDTGIKANWYWQGFELAAEAWNGDSWSTTSGKGNITGLARHQGHFWGVKTDVAAWYAQGKAEQRIDGRYSAGHSHSATTITAPDVSFSGDVAMLGSYIFLSQQVSKDVLWLAQYEWIHSQSEGEIADTTQNALLDQTLDGYRFMVGLSMQNHQFTVQQEYLAINNKFTNASTSLIEQQGLYNDNFEPNRLMAVYHWRFNDNFTFRVETVRDETQAENQSSGKADQYWSIGLLWQHKLL